MRVFASDILSGQVAFVTGGGTGIGKEIARVLGAHGAKLAIMSRRQEVLDAAAAEFSGEGLTCLAAAGDVRDPESVRAAIDRTIAKFGRLDIVVNNAASSAPTTSRAWPSTPGSRITAAASSTSRRPSRPREPRSRPTWRRQRRASTRSPAPAPWSGGAAASGSTA